MNVVDPIVKRIEYRKRALLSLSKSFVRRKLSLFTIFLDEIEVGEVLCRNSGLPVLGQKGIVELRANMHSATQSTVIRNDNSSFTTVVVFNFSRVAGVTIALDESVDAREYINDFGCLPALGVGERDRFESLRFPRPYYAR